MSNTDRCKMNQNHRSEYSPHHTTARHNLDVKLHGIYAYLIQFSSLCMYVACMLTGNIYAKMQIFRHNLQQLFDINSKVYVVWRQLAPADVKQHEMRLYSIKLHKITDLQARIFLSFEKIKSVAYMQHTCIWRQTT